MTHLSDVRDPSTALSVAQPGRGFIRWVCTSNPFYVLSALLVCLGLWTSFGDQTRAEQTWALMFGLAAYTLLLAVPACLLVRIGGVWQDVRTVLLLVVLMFLATSVTFDETLARNPDLGITCYLAGLLFAIAVSEGLLRGMRLGLPAGFRAPYYLILALFFLYPVALVPLLDQPRSEALQWGLFGFSTAAGLAFLTLLPAIRRGPQYVLDNASPWHWPLYPWTLFLFLGFGVAGRSFLLCWSMQHVERTVPEQIIFGPYFLVPFLLAVAVLLLEIGLVARHRGLLQATLAWPSGLVLVAAVGHRSDDLFQGFLTLFLARLGGTPLYLTLLALVGFYAYASLRRVPMASGAMTAAMAAMAVVGPGTMDWEGLVPPRSWPILAVAALQLGIGLRRREAWRCLVGAGCLIVATMLGPWPTQPFPHRGSIAIHLALTAVLVIGSVFEDAFGRMLRTSGALLAMLACLVASTGRFDQVDIGAYPVSMVYPPLMAAVMAGYGLILGHRGSLAAASIALSGWIGAMGWRGYCSLRQMIVGLDAIVLGVAMLGLANVVSLAKAGLLPRSIATGKGKAPDPQG